MTKAKALKALDTLDAYWAQERIVDQNVPFIPMDGNPCGCFGAHTERALNPPGPPERFLLTGIGSPDLQGWDYKRGWKEFDSIARGLGLNVRAAEVILMEESGSDDPFGNDEWTFPPHKAWPRISKRLRERAA